MNIDAEVEVIEADVAEYKIRENENIFFLFNPFDSVVMRKVLFNLNMSIMRRNRKVWVIYNNPIFGGMFEEQENFQKLEEHSIYGSKFKLYVHNS